jgi:hypothetical protein
MIHVATNRCLVTRYFGVSLTNAPAALGGVIFAPNPCNLPGKQWGDIAARRFNGIFTLKKMPAHATSSQVFMIFSIL